ncbi:MAG: ATP-binding protein [Chthoniobacteraceae bacterium]
MFYCLCKMHNNRTKKVAENQCVVFCLFYIVNRSKNIRTECVDLIPKLVEAGLAGNRQRLELLSLTAIRALKAESPDISAELGDLLAKFSANDAALRWHAAEPPPADVDAGLALVRIMPVDYAVEPVFEAISHATIMRFLCERRESERLLREGFAPPRTLLLKGLPGTGKTMLARWLAQQLGLRLVVLDLATAISSFLGKTGANLRRSLDYARATPCLLLLDEFDAIGKRRDDNTEVGELKRIVNVLLKELEEWPLHSVLVAATNHPELLDPAIHRRFEVVLETQLPGETEREAILIRACGRFSAMLPGGFFSALARVTVGNSGSDLETLTQSVVRRHVVEQIGLGTAFVEAIANRLPEMAKEHLGMLVKTMKEMTGLTVRDLAELFGKSSTTIQHHLSKKNSARKTRKKKESSNA